MKPAIHEVQGEKRVRLTKEQKKMREEMDEIRKELDKEAGRDRIKYSDSGFGDKSRSFVNLTLFSPCTS